MKNDRDFSDWQPDRYLKFKEERTRPARDLAAGIEKCEPARIVDIGCGPGNSTMVLQEKWPGAELTGLDSSAAMLEKATNSYPGIEWLQRDLTCDLSDLGEFDIVFSNAVLQWIPDIRTALSRLFAMLRPGGVLAFQVPYSAELPSHQAMRELTGSPAWRGCFADPVPQPTYRSSSDYYEILSGLSDRLSLWETRYIQIMGSHSDIVEWNKGSALRPFLDALADDQLRAKFLTEYTEAIRQKYPVEKNGSVLYPFTRIFALAYRES